MALDSERGPEVSGFAGIDALDHSKEKFFSPIDDPATQDNSALSATMLLIGARA
jgi:alcohol dehydrogenase class IV